MKKTTKPIYPREVNMKTGYVFRKFCVNAVIGALNFNDVYIVFASSYVAPKHTRMTYTML